MPNSFFRFRQFTVHQDNTAMKVCTDACLFGAWVASHIRGSDSIGKILDIGAGTGLLSLMLAQACNALIDAVEIDEDACRQAAENFGASPWKHRLHAYHHAIQDFRPVHKYDFIVSNPPFYGSDLKSPDHKRNLAHHSTALKFEELLKVMSSLLNDGGKAALLLPFGKESQYEKILKENQFNVEEKVLVKQSQSHHYFRIMYLLNNKTSFSDAGVAPADLSIKDDANQYTSAFSALLSDYYLQ